MNFKNLDKFYLVIMFIFCLFNPFYFIGLFFVYNFLKFEERFYNNISIRKKNLVNNKNLIHNWPSSGVSEEKILENKISNQQMKLMRTNSIEDVKVLNKLENDLEEYYKKLGS